jgi:hypothetical protein
MIAAATPPCPAAAAVPPAGAAAGPAAAPMQDFAAMLSATVAMPMPGEAPPAQPLPETVAPEAAPLGMPTAGLVLPPAFEKLDEVLPVPRDRDGAESAGIADAEIEPGLPAAPDPVLLVPGQAAPPPLQPPPGTAMTGTTEFTSPAADGSRTAPVDSRPPGEATQPLPAPGTAPADPASPDAPAVPLPNAGAAAPVAPMPARGGTTPPTTASDAAPTTPSGSAPALESSAATRVTAPPHEPPAGTQQVPRASATDRPSPLPGRDAAPANAGEIASQPVGSAAPELRAPADARPELPAALPGFAPTAQTAPATPATAEAAPVAHRAYAQPTPAAQLVPSVVAIAPRGGAAAPTRLVVAIRPVELGQVEVTVERAQDGPAQLRILAERPETLTLLLRDRPMLEQALQRAGIETQSATLSFGLSDTASHGQGQGQGQDAPRRDGGAPSPSPRRGFGPGTDATASPTPPPRNLSRGLLDLAL